MNIIKKNSLVVMMITMVFANAALAQTKYFTRNGNISFYSDAPLEKIEANNHKVSSVLDPATGQVEFSVLMKAFEFEKALMQEHFNENYVESTTYPKSTFKGTITNNKEVDYSKDGTYNVTVDGKLTLHGVTKDVTSKGTMTVKDGKPAGKSEFKILVADYNISVPGLLKDKVAKEVRIVVEVNYEPLTKS